MNEARAGSQRPTATTVGVLYFLATRIGEGTAFLVGVARLQAAWLIGAGLRPTARQQHLDEGSASWTPSLVS